MSPLVQSENRRKRTVHMTKRMLSRIGNFRHLQNVVNEFISWNILELDMFGDAIRLRLVAIGTSAATGARCIGVSVVRKRWWGATEETLVSTCFNMFKLHTIWAPRGMSGISYAFHFRTRLNCFRLDFNVLRSIENWSTVGHSESLHSPSALELIAHATNSL